jgi:hypothetical protein
VTVAKRSARACVIGLWPVAPNLSSQRGVEGLAALSAGEQLPREGETCGIYSFCLRPLS